LNSRRNYSLSESQPTIRSKYELQREQYFVYMKPKITLKKKELSIEELKVMHKKVKEEIKNDPYIYKDAISNKKK
jgi:hypothetical protein